MIIPPVLKYNNKSISIRLIKSHPSWPWECVERFLKWPLIYTLVHLLGPEKNTSYKYLLISTHLWTV